jgi:hypothetical protein
MKPGSRAGVRRLAAALLAALAAAACGQSAPETGPPPLPTEPAEPRPSTQAPSLTAGPLVPTDPSLFSPTFYPDVEELEPASGTAWTETRALGRALELVTARNPDDASEARRLFADAEVVRVAPDPVVRAALVSLLGTIAEPAVDWVAFEGPFSQIELGDPGGGATARSLADPDGTQRIVIDGRFRFEDPGLLSAVLAHEALHADGEVSDLEELVALSFQALVHLEQLLADAAIGAERTLLAQRMDPWVLARLNTRAPGSADLRLVLNDGSQSIFPGGIDRPYFAALFDPGAAPTPGNALLARLAAAVAEPGARAPGAPDFSLETIEFLDGNQGALDADELARAAEALDLRSADGA